MKPAINDTHLATSGSGITCPADRDDDVGPAISRWDMLVFPKHRSTVVQYLNDEVGNSELHLFYGDKEISFDEPDLFPFGETLAQQARFTAGDAVGWGEGYDWPRIRSLLQELIDEGVLVHAAEADRGSVEAPDLTRASTLPPSRCPVARSWDECEAITKDIAGRPVELGYLELIVPIFRVAHIAVDADQRQVGEANVFPPALRMDVPTEWRTCNLPGSRYQSELPMNVTAMRVMRAHWPQMMAAVLRVRQGYLRRFPEADGAWSVGHIERLTGVVLALPSYQLMRRTGRVENGDLHPALSSLFRVTDGVRLTMHQMMVIPINEPVKPPNQVITVDEILDYAERNYSFHSTYGVCAGPRAMVRELVQVLVEGRGNTDYAAVRLEPAVQAALNDLDAAIDYGLHGMRAYAAVFSLWPVMARAYEAIFETLAAWPLIDTPRLTTFRDSMQAVAGTLLKRTYLGLEEWRASREHVYADMYRQCERGLGSSTRVSDEPELQVLLAPVWTGAHREIETELQEILHGWFELPDESCRHLLRQLSECVMDFLLRVQAVLRTAVAVQTTINQLLGRDQPSRAMSAADINVYDLMQEIKSEHLPYLIDDLERLLGVNIDLDMSSLSITRRGAAA